MKPQRGRSPQHGLRGHAEGAAAGGLAALAVAPAAADFTSRAPLSRGLATFPSQATSSHCPGPAECKTSRAQGKRRFPGSARSQRGTAASPGQPRARGGRSSGWPGSLPPRQPRNPAVLRARSLPCHRSQRPRCLRTSGSTLVAVVTAPTAARWPCVPPRALSWQEDPRWGHRGPAGTRHGEHACPLRSRPAQDVERLGSGWRNRAVICFCLISPRGWLGRLS